MKVLPVSLLPSSGSNSPLLNQHLRETGRHAQLSLLFKTHLQHSNRSVLHNNNLAKRHKSTFELTRQVIATGLTARQ